MTRILVITALGRGSFTPHQLGRLDRLGAVDIVEQPEPLTPGEFVELARTHDVVAMTRRPLKHLHRETLARLPRLRALVVHTTGTHWIDTAWLDRRRVVVHSLGGYATDSVAEHTLAAMLTLSRRTHLSHDRSRHLVADSVSLRGFELRDRRVGLIGYGRIGRRIHQLITPITGDVVVHDPVYGQSVGFNRALDCDLLVLAASHHYGRPPIIGAAELALTSARYLVNAACDELVDHHAVVNAIRRRSLDGYLVDEFDPVLAEADVEPGRIVQTMHTGWYSDESMARGKEEWVGLIEQAVEQVGHHRRVA